MKDMTLKDMAEQWWTDEKRNKLPRQGTPAWVRVWQRFCLECIGIKVKPRPRKVMGADHAHARNA